MISCEMRKLPSIQFWFDSCNQNKINNNAELTPSDDLTF